MFINDIIYLIVSKCRLHYVISSEMHTTAVHIKVLP